MANRNGYQAEVYGQNDKLLYKDDKHTYTAIDKKMSDTKGRVAAEQPTLFNDKQFQIQNVETTGSPEKIRNFTEESVTNEERFRETMYQKDSHKSGHSLAEEKINSTEQETLLYTDDKHIYASVADDDNQQDDYYKDDEHLYDIVADDVGVKRSEAETIQISHLDNSHFGNDWTEDLETSKYDKAADRKPNVLQQRDADIFGNGEDTNSKLYEDDENIYAEIDDYNGEHHQSAANKHMKQASGLHVQRAKSLANQKAVNETLSKADSILRKVLLFITYL